LPIAAVASVAIALAPAASPQTLSAPTGAVVTSTDGQRLVQSATDTPAPSTEMNPGPSGPPQLAMPLDLRVAKAGEDVAGLTPEIECMAKVVHHEAANQSLKGQLAVAQLILNRVKSPIFPKSVCAVVNQPGQFFHTARYNVPASSPRWHTAVGVARIAITLNAPQVAPGALFFHASYVRPPGFFRRRTEVARIGGNVFYR
jgi:spore germination cell wall hydrolase CwlJ-like protein